MPHAREASCPCHRQKRSGAKALVYLIRLRAPQLCCHRPARKFPSTRGRPPSRDAPHRASASRNRSRDAGCHRQREIHLPSATDTSPQSDNWRRGPQGVANVEPPRPGSLSRARFCQLPQRLLCALPRVSSVHSHLVRGGNYVHHAANKYSLRERPLRSILLPGHQARSAEQPRHRVAGPRQRRLLRLRE